MKKFNEFINEEEKFNGVNISQYDIIYDVEDLFKKYLKEIQIGSESASTSSASTAVNIDGIGKRNDYILEDKTFSHVIIGVKYFFGNSSFTDEFNTLLEMADYLKKIDDTIKSKFTIEKTSRLNEYFVYLVKIDDELKNLLKSYKTIKKFNI